MVEDLLYLKSELPKYHINLFNKISEEEWNSKLDELIGNVPNLNEAEVYTSVDQIIALIGDAHTSLNYWDGYEYPLEFKIMDGNVYIVDTNEDLHEMLFSKVKYIDGVDIDTIKSKLTTLVPYQNDNWVLTNLQSLLTCPIYLYGMDIIKNEKEAIFTVDQNGIQKDYSVPSVPDEDTVLVNSKTPAALLSHYDENYAFQYLKEFNSIYFQYNDCAEMKAKPFIEFNDQMFRSIRKNNPTRIILDLRNNTGGNSAILEPFIKQLKYYYQENPGIKVYILIGPVTFSSAMHAIYETKDAVPDSLLLGEPTGGSIDGYGNTKSFVLPNSQLKLYYSTTYFELSKEFKYKNNGVNTCEPDVLIQPTIDDYMSGTDPVLDYVLKH